jgi:hypothetical protein
MSSITYEADFVAEVQRRTDGRYNTHRAIRRVERVVPHQVAPPKQTHAVHALIASEPLQWTTQSTVIVTPSSVSAAAATVATAVHKYELHGGLALKTSVTLDTVLFNLAAGLFERGMQPVVVASGTYGAPPLTAVAYAVPGIG